VQQYLDEASDTLKAVFDKALRVRKKGKFDNARLIVAALLDSPDEGATHSELLEKIRASEAKYPAGNLSYFLKELQTSDRGAVVRFDGASGRFSFADPLYRAFATALFKSAEDVSGTPTWLMFPGAMEGESGDLPTFDDIKASVYDNIMITFVQMQNK
jgi:hypothetical protein